MSARRRARTLVAALTVAVAALGAGRAPGGGGAPPAGADGSAVAPVDWAPCPEVADGVDCASYPVPVDHADPLGPEMRLLLARLPATGQPDQRLGTLFINPGGPGGSATDFLVAYAGRFSPEVRAAFDIVSLNPRGVAGSSPEIDCPRPPYQPTLPTDWTAYLDTTSERAARASSACQVALARTGASYGTNQVADDLELLRRAVGDQGLTYWGVSYGSRIGEVYAQRHPQRVRAMILDGAVDPRSSALTFNSERATSFDAAFARFTDTFPGAGEDYDTVVSALAQGPIEVIDAQTGKPRPLDAGLFVGSAVMAALPAEELWPLLDIQLADLADQVAGGPPARVLLVEGTPNTTTVSVQVNCTDLPQRYDTATLADTAHQMATEAPVLGPWLATTLAGCQGFASPPDPVPATPPPTGSLAPVLVLGATDDPATPYAWAQEMARFLPGAVLATYDGAQHGTWNSASVCIRAIGDAYVLDLVLPPPGTTCPFVPPGPSGNEAP